MAAGTVLSPVRGVSAALGLQRTGRALGWPAAAGRAGDAWPRCMPRARCDCGRFPHLPSGQRRAGSLGVSANKMRAQPRVHKHLRGLDGRVQGDAGLTPPTSRPQHARTHTRTPRPCGNPQGLRSHWHRGSRTAPPPCWAGRVLLRGRALVSLRGGCLQSFASGQKEQEGTTWRHHMHPASPRQSCSGLKTACHTACAEPASTSSHFSKTGRDRYFV